MDVSRSISPIDGRVVAERPLASEAAIAAALVRARSAQAAWRQVSVGERAALCNAMVDAFEERGDAIAHEITLQMGRPIAHSPGEIRGFAERARTMISLAEASLAPIDPGPKVGFLRFIRREPVGVVLTVAPWNYPYLTAVNSVVPAIMAGNAVLLRHSAQTPLCGERLAEAFTTVGLPEGVLQVIHADHAATSRLIAAAGGDGPDFVAFTGSVAAGHAVQRAASGRFIGTGLELGGKDPAYVRSDAALAPSVAELVDGAFFNAGQSCCGIERIYVHAALYDDFVAAFGEAVRAYRLGNPLDPATSLGPCIRPAAADFVRGQVAEAEAAGAVGLIDASAFGDHGPGDAYLAPQVLVGVDHGMRVMREESFGPVVGIMAVADDAQAVQLMNDSPYGLTASVWTSDEAAGVALGDRIATGTFFVNRCDTLDPVLAWTGVKDSGRGCTLSRVGYEVLTRPKSYHVRASGW